MNKSEFDELEDIVDDLEDDMVDELENELEDELVDELEKEDDLEEIENIDEVDEEEMEGVWKDKKGDKKKSAFSELMSFVLYMAVAVAVTFLIIQFVGQRTVVSGPSMQHTLYNGDNIILDKISYRFHDPERFDIVVFPVPAENKHYIKRIIGLPGETVQIINGFVYVSNEEGKLEQLEESYGSEILIDMTTGEYMTTAPLKLGDNEYYVLGDNRNNSTDSTEMGAISGDIIEGRAWVRIYPFNAIGVLD